MVEKKLLLVGSSPPPHHGSTLYFQKLLNSLLQSDFQVVHLDTSDRRGLDNIGKLDLGNVGLGIKNLIQMVVSCLKNRPDLVYIPVAQGPLPFLRDGLLIITAKIFSEGRIVIHLHGSSFRKMYDGTSPLMRIFIRISLGCVDTAIVLGENLRSIFDGLVKEIRVVPNGIEDLYEKIPRAPERAHRVVSIHYLGNLGKKKGILDLVHAAKIVIDRSPDAVFRLAGLWRDSEVETKTEVEKYIDQNGLQSKIEFLGYVEGEAKKEFLLNADIVVLPSWNEGLPISILEAMCAGKPVVSSKNVGAIPEVVLDNVTGLLVEKQHPQELADALLSLAADPEKRKRMGDAGRKRYEEKYTLKANISLMTEVFHDTLDR